MPGLEASPRPVAGPHAVLVDNYELAVGISVADLHLVSQGFPGPLGGNSRTSPVP